MKHITKVLFFIVLITFYSCGSENQNQQSATDKREVRTDDESSKNQNKEDILRGTAKVAIGDDTFLIEEFRKNKTEATYTDKSISIRLTNATNDKFIMIRMEGEGVFDKRPLEINIEQGNSDAATNASVTLVGFFDTDDPQDQVILKDGVLQVNELDEESLELNLVFNGEGGKMMDIKNEQSMPIEGAIDMTLDNKVDTRSKS